jgi:DNA (cytosine-5)-methyltransferase 1
LTRLQGAEATTPAAHTGADRAEHFGARKGSASPRPLVLKDRGSASGVADDGLQSREERVAAFISAYYGSDQDTPLADPMHTVTTKPRFALVTVAGQQYAIADIGMRMLQPRELYRAQGFPEAYVIDRGHDGRVLPKDAQVRMCGNSVSPPLAAAIVAANYSERVALKEAA